MEKCSVCGQEVCECIGKGLGITGEEAEEGGGSE